jgi:hypothetical protein
MINNRIKQYVSCSFEYNDTSIVLLEVESDNNDFATWVMSSEKTISEEDIIKILEMRYSEQKQLDVLQPIYSDSLPE